MKSVLHLKQTLFLKKEEGKGGKKANQLNLKIRRNCHEWNFKQEFMVRWQVHSRDYKSPRPVGRRFIMKSPFNYEFIDCLHPATPDAWWRPRSREGVDFALLFPEKYGFPLYATRRFRRNLFSRCPVLSFVFKKKTRPSYDLSPRRDRSLSPSSLKVKTGLVENRNIHTRARTHSVSPPGQTEKRTECSKWVSHGSHGKWMFCREWNMPWTSPSARGSAPLTGSDASTLESFTGLCHNLLRANVKLSLIVCLINFFFFFFFISFHVTVTRHSRIRSWFIWIGFKWHVFFSFFFFFLALFYYSMMYIYIYSMIFFVFFSVRLIVECLLIRASDGDFNFQATKHDGELERRRACAWNINEFTGERIL